MRLVFSRILVFAILAALVFPGPLQAQTEGVEYIRIPTPQIIERELSRGQSVVLEEYDLEVEFQGMSSTGEALLALNFAGRSTYQATPHRPEHGNKVLPPPAPSANLLDYASRLYRNHYLATGEPQGENGGREIVDLEGGYGNFTGANRFFEHCIADGSFDAYYDERCDYGTVPFKIGEEKRATEFAIRLTGATRDRASIAVTFIGDGRFKPTGKSSTADSGHRMPKPQPQTQVPGIAPDNSGTVAEKLRQLKSLLDERVITQEEFEAKKKELLKQF